MRTCRRCAAAVPAAWLVFGLVTLFSSIASAQTGSANETRVALVIGIGAYQSATRLTNPTNDARRMTEALRRLNFEVDEQLDPDFRRLTRALREFGIRAQKSDTALIFYAGHGMQVERENYIIPADARLERERDLLYEALPLQLMLGEASQAKKIGIVLLDACRNNPFVERMSRSYMIAGRAPATAQGLARVDNVPRNTIVAMATKADQIAEDGSGENSPFTQAILAHLQIPGLELSLFFRSVRDTVLKATNFRQEPFVFSSLGAEPFYFFPRPPNRPPEIKPIATLEVTDAAGPTPLAIPRPTDPDQDPLSVRVVGLPRSGEIRIGERVVAMNDVLSLDRFMTATFKPDGKMLGKVGTFDFLIEDGRGGNVLGSLPVTILSSNQPPVVEAERAVRVYPSVLGIVPPTDPDGDPISITVSGLPGRGVVRNGASTLKNGDRLRPQDLAALVFVPEAGAVGDVGAFRYVVQDNRGGRAEGALTIEVAKPDESAALVSDAKTWEALRQDGDMADLDAFLRLFPNSRFAADAQRRRSELAAAAPASAPVATAPVRPPSPAPPPTAAASKPPPQTAAAPEPARPQRPPDNQTVALATPSPPVAADAAPADDRQRTSRPELAVVAPPAPPTARPSGDSRTFQDCPTCPVMLRVPGGSFLMGQADDPSASPVHRVTMRPFAIGQYSTTAGEWKACVDEGGCNFTPRMVRSDDRLPVHNLSWDDTQQYLAWLSKKTKRAYRLPTEAEWEYAARANTTTRYWWGNEGGAALANCVDCGGQQDSRSPLPVGSFKPNPFGLYDVHGGIAQWVADCWFQNHQNAPSDGSAREQRACQKRVLRGGSFRNDRNGIAAGTRSNYDASVRYIAHGFRVARNLD